MEESMGKRQLSVEDEEALQKVFRKVGVAAPGSVVEVSEADLRALKNFVPVPPLPPATLSEIMQANAEVWREEMEKWEQEAAGTVTWEVRNNYCVMARLCHGIAKRYEAKANQAKESRASQLERAAMGDLYEVKPKESEG